MSVKSYANEEYLGDGVYIMDDVGGYLITANGTPGYGATDKVFLEPDVAQRLVESLVNRLNRAP